MGKKRLMSDVDWIHLGGWVLSLGSKGTIFEAKKELFGSAQFSQFIYEGAHFGDTQLFLILQQ